MDKIEGIKVCTFCSKSSLGGKPIFHSFDCQLFEPKPSRDTDRDTEMKRLKEDHQIKLQMLEENLTEMYQDKCRQRVERIKKELGRKLRNRFGVLDKFWDWWREFWKREGIDA